MSVSDEHIYKKRLPSGMTKSDDILPSYLMCIRMPSRRPQMEMNIIFIMTTWTN